jgi:hypothetical protein
MTLFDTVAVPFSYTTPPVTVHKLFWLSIILVAEGIVVPEAEAPPVLAVIFAEQDAFVPPLLPIQLQAQGPMPLMSEAEPAEQRLPVGAVATAVLLAEPQEALTAVAVELCGLVVKVQLVLFQYDHTPELFSW